MNAEGRALFDFTFIYILCLLFVAPLTTPFSLLVVRAKVSTINLIVNLPWRLGFRIVTALKVIKKLQASVRHRQPNYKTDLAFTPGVLSSGYRTQVRCTCCSTGIASAAFADCDAHIF